MMICEDRSSDTLITQTTLQNSIFTDFINTTFSVVQSAFYKKLFEAYCFKNKVNFLKQ